MGKLIFFLSLMILVNISWTQIINADTTAANEVEPEIVTGSGDGEPETTEAARDQDTTVGNEVTDVNTEENSTEVNEDEDNTTNLPEESQAATEIPPAVCSTPGLQQADEENCQQFYECSAEGSDDGSLHLIKKSCPENKAYNRKLKHCSRDIASCPLEIECLHEGVLPDPASNSSYYLCQKYYTEESYHIFHVECESHHIFYPTINKCYIDMTQPFIAPFVPNRIKDIDEVKAELKLLKKAEKLVLKEMKIKEKEKKNLEKEKAELAKAEAKKEEKLKKQQAKEEASTFTCDKAGNHASKVSNTSYIECIIKKDSFKAVSKQCIGATTFNPEIGSCVATDSAKDNSLVSDDEDEDED